MTAHSFSVVSYWFIVALRKYTLITKTGFVDTVLKVLSPGVADRLVGNKSYCTYKMLKLKSASLGEIT